MMLRLGHVSAKRWDPSNVHGCPAGLPHQLWPLSFASRRFRRDERPACIKVTSEAMDRVLFKSCLLVKVVDESPACDPTTIKIQEKEKQRAIVQQM